MFARNPHIQTSGPPQTDLMLMVCEANICRSPVAQILAQRYFTSFKVLSAGLRTFSGLPAHPHMLRLMTERGLDLSQHRTQRIHPLLCNRARMILVMDEEQKAELRRRYPHLTEKIHCIGHFDHIDIPDPMGQDPDFFIEVVREIDRCLQSWKNRPNLLNMSKL